MKYYMEQRMTIIEVLCYHIISMKLKHHHQYMQLVEDLTEKEYLICI